MKVTRTNIKKIQRVGKNKPIAFPKEKALFQNKNGNGVVCSPSHRNLSTHAGRVQCFVFDARHHVDKYFTKLSQNWR